MSFYEDVGDEIEFAENVDVCLVCGTSGGNCKGSSDEHDMIQFLPEAPDYDPYATWTLDRDIYEETQVGTRKVTKLKYKKGTRIRPEVAKELGLFD